MKNKTNGAGAVTEALKWQDGKARSALGDQYAIHQLSTNVWTATKNGVELDRWRSTANEARAVAQADYDRLAALRPEEAAGQGEALRYCDYCKAWQSKPCGDGCVWRPDMPTALATPRTQAPVAPDIVERFRMAIWRDAPGSSLKGVNLND